MKQAGILVWDCAACQSKSTEFIHKLQKAMKLLFASIIVVADDPQAYPQAVNDLAISLPVTFRFGPNATRDTVIDVIHLLAQAKREYTVFILCENFPVWIALFQRIEPKNVFFISSRDPRECIDFSFLSPNLSVNVLTWPNLEQVAVGATTQHALDLASHAQPKGRRYIRSKHPYPTQLGLMKRRNMWMKAMTMKKISLELTISLQEQFNH